MRGNLAWGVHWPWHKALAVANRIWWYNPLRHTTTEKYTIENTLARCHSSVGYSHRPASCSAVDPEPTMIYSQMDPQHKLSIEMRKNKFIVHMMHFENAIGIMSFIFLYLTVLANKQNTPGIVVQWILNIRTHYSRVYCVPCLTDMNPDACSDDKQTVVVLQPVIQIVSMDFHGPLLFCWSMMMMAILLNHKICTSYVVH